jgi:hypothetical protein
MNIRTIIGRTKGIDPFYGPLTKYMHASVADLRAEGIIGLGSAHITSSKNTSNEFFSWIPCGTLEATISYENPVDIGTAVLEMLMINDATGYDFTKGSDKLIIANTKILTGTWSWGLSEGQNNKTQCYLRFLGDIRASEQSQFESLADMIYCPSSILDSYVKRSENAQKYNLLPIPEEKEMIMLVKTFDEFDENDILRLRSDISGIDGIRQTQLDIFANYPIDSEDKTITLMYKE